MFASRAARAAFDSLGAGRNARPTTPELAAGAGG
jgi:hypothetical protein